MDFSQFPAQWEWVALILGGVALIVAVQPFLQFVWGRVQLTADLDAKDNDDESRVLICWLYNWPIRNRLLRFLKIKRDTANAVSAECIIKDIRTKDTIVEDALLNIMTAKNLEGIEVELPSSITPAWIELIQTDKTGKTTMLGGNKPITLKPGKYALGLKVLYDGEKLVIKKFFSVGTAPYELFWGRY